MFPHSLAIAERFQKIHPKASFSGSARRADERDFAFREPTANEIFQLPVLRQAVFANVNDYGSLGNGGTRARNRAFAVVVTLPFFAVQPALAKLRVNLERIAAVLLRQQDAQRKVRRGVILFVVAHVPGHEALKPLFLAYRNGNNKPGFVRLRRFHAVIERNNLLLPIHEVRWSLAQMAARKREVIAVPFDLHGFQPEVRLFESRAGYRADPEDVRAGPARGVFAVTVQVDNERLRFLYEFPRCGIATSVNIH